MKRNPTDARRKRLKDDVPGSPPTFEAIAMYLLDSVVHSAEGQKLRFLPPKQKQHYRQFEQHPERLTVSGYEGITRRLADYLAQGTPVLDGKPHTPNSNRMAGFFLTKSTKPSGTQILLEPLQHPGVCFPKARAI